MHKSTATHSTSGGGKRAYKRVRIQHKLLLPWHESNTVWQGTPVFYPLSYPSLCLSCTGSYTFLDYNIVFYPFFVPIFSHTLFFSLSFPIVAGNYHAVGCTSEGGSMSHPKPWHWTSWNGDDVVHAKENLFPPKHRTCCRGRKHKKNPPKRTLLHPPSGVRPEERESCTIWQWVEGRRANFFIQQWLRPWSRLGLDWNSAFYPCVNPWTVLTSGERMHRLISMSLENWKPSPTGQVSRAGEVRKNGLNEKVKKKFCNLIHLFGFGFSARKQSGCKKQYLTGGA